MLPHAIILGTVLVGVLFFSAQSGLHLQDGIYTAGTDDPAVARIIAADYRFTVYLLDPSNIHGNRHAFDLFVIKGNIISSGTVKGSAAAAAFERDYENYKNSVYSTEEDIFAAYPLLIDQEAVKSELDFSVAGSGIQAIAPSGLSSPPVPSGPVVTIPPPIPAADLSAESLRSAVVRPDEGLWVLRPAGSVSQGPDTGAYTTPSRLSPPLPLDSLVLIFVFIYPLYFIAQFLMMSVMNERIEHSGETLLSTPAKGWEIIMGKTLPYGVVMLIISSLFTLYLGAPPALILPLIPIILFFLANGIIIGMVARSFRELSFLAIFFSTVTTVYLFFPSIFAEVHIISLVSPLTLMILTLGHEPYTLAQYLYSTSVFWITGIILLFAAAVNFREERLFSSESLLSRVISYVTSAISQRRPYLSLFLLGLLTVPFVLMVQLLLLVLVFNLPLPLSLIALLVTAAAVEEIAKSVGLYTIATRFPGLYSWRMVLAGGFVIALAFLMAEKLLLLVTVSQIAESVFGTVLFASLGLFTIPFLIHFSGILVTGTSLKLRAAAGYLPGLIAATVIHSAANAWLLRGWFL
jgi:ABC-type Na+ efflux pump permease subunit